MNEEILRRLIERITVDEEFQQAVLADPAAALAEWGIAPEEAALLAASLMQSGAQEELDERMSKSTGDYLFGGGGPGG